MGAPSSHLPSRRLRRRSRSRGGRVVLERPADDFPFLGVDEAPGADRNVAAAHAHEAGAVQLLDGLADGLEHFGRGLLEVADSPSVKN